MKPIVIAAIILIITGFICLMGVILIWCKSRCLCGSPPPLTEEQQQDEQRERERQKTERRLRLLDIKLKIKKFGTIKGDNKQTSCSICFEEFDESVDVRETPCKHLYHDPCIIKWIKLKIEDPECPFCRTSLII